MNQPGRRDLWEAVERWRKTPPGPVVTYVPRRVKEALEARQDWPELEARMKAMYGEDWRLEAYEEVGTDEMRDLHKYDDCRTGSGLTWPCGAYRPREARGGEHLADIEKLIEDLKKTCWGKSAHVVDDERRKASTALSTLQAENEKLRAELEQVKAERDAAGECIETVYSAILIKCKSDAVRTIEKWRGQRRRADNGAADCF